MIEVELPDGRVVEINTTDPAVAARAAQKFMTSSAPKPDKYQQAALDEQASMKAKGIDTGAGLTRRLAHGATLGADSTLLAAATTPLEMIKRGTFNPIEGYNYAKAREDQIMGDARKNTGLLGSAAEVLGGVTSGAGLARGGLTAARLLAPEAGLLARTGASAADAAGIGAFSGAMEGNGLAERGANALKGGLLGGILGGATPGALSLGGAALSPILSNIRARVNPEGFARSQVARGVSESGRTPAQIADDIRSAANEGQGMFTAADAMGNAGQRMLSSTARAPGQARTDVVNFLDNRQAGQGRRISGALAEGFDSPQTAAQTEARLTAQRGANADADFSAVRAGAGRTDVVPAINRIDQTIGTGPGQALQAANDSVEGALRPFRERLARVNPDDFEAVQRIRFDMADAAQNARQSGYGNRAREIGNAVRELDAAMEQASSGYRQANRNFAQASRDIEAVGQGRTAAMRGRTEDIIPEFQGQSPAGQGAYRAGYVDPLIQQAQGAAFGVNKARPLINDAFQAEAGAMAPGNPLMQRRIGRENTMFQTRNAATGNSKTAENLADDAAMGVDPTLIGQVLSGNWTGALRSVIASGSNALSGNTPAVRQAVADMLMTRGGNVSAAQFQRMIDETVQRIQQVQRMARSAGRGAAGGLAVAGPGQDKPYTGPNLGPLRR
jgi:hypothetical protein